MEDLEGKVAVVTGAASGIGLALSERFADEGMAVVLADVDEAALDVAVAKVAGRGVDALGVGADVTDPSAVDDLAAAARARFGAYHVVCNNAGVAGHGGVSWKLPPEEWRWVIEVNLWGVINGIRSFVPGLVEQGAGHVVNTASLAGWLAVPGLAPYAVTKHAVLGLSESLRHELELSGSGVGVSVLCPGFLNTRIAEPRGWPERLGPEPAAPADPIGAFMADFLAGSVEGGLPAATAADAVVEGVRANRFLLTTHPAEVIAAAEGRVAVAGGAAPQVMPT